ncbi:hypothetical protein GCM10027598_17390 [Amycolatopsis oliviviridis]|uniref:Uncharacterized protein n=1 Tax=Amycolatopsis oliviviridis TaxID=1471590 RepID=A0ABQ3M5R1_9PSEU|nr:hypothetical protein [Amycolatopsis oliviviridis]GHH34361.1 hypothetical protein GCM10017790_74150 [Amycolatopsis oliviviridis]
MTTDSSLREEPQLTIRPKPSAFFLRRRFLRSFGPALALAVSGLVVLLLTGTIVVPFQQTLVLRGKMGSKSDLFEDAKVQEILMRHHIRVLVTRAGSRDVATHDLSQYDFVFMSGEPAASLVRRSRANEWTGSARQPFTSPIVLATYRRYAETLVRKQIASKPAGQPDSLYYTLDTGKFIETMRLGQTWDSLGVREFGAPNGNRVLAQTSNVCDSNSGATYLILLAFLENGRQVPVVDPRTAGPPDLSGARALANRIKPLVAAQGFPSADLSESYANLAEGDKPIVVIYEHQYLAMQLRAKAQSGQPDLDRVLLYPKDNILTKPQFLALKPEAERLGELITFDPDLQRRAMELGFGVATPAGSTKSARLYDFLREQGLTAPEIADNDSTTPLPDNLVLEEMIRTVGDCP